MSIGGSIDALGAASDAFALLDNRRSSDAGRTVSPKLRASCNQMMRETATCAHQTGGRRRAIRTQASTRDFTTRSLTYTRGRARSGSPVRTGDRGQAPARVVGDPVHIPDVDRSRSTAMPSIAATAQMRQADPPIPPPVHLALRAHTGDRTPAAMQEPPAWRGSREYPKLAQIEATRPVNRFLDAPRGRRSSGLQRINSTLALLTPEARAPSA